MLNRRFHTEALALFCIFCSRFQRDVICGKAFPFQVVIQYVDNLKSIILRGKQNQLHG